MYGLQGGVFYCLACFQGEGVEGLSIDIYLFAYYLLTFGT